MYFPLIKQKQQQNKINAAAVSASGNSGYSLSLSQSFLAKWGWGFCYYAVDRKILYFPVNEKQSSIRWFFHQTHKQWRNQRIHNPFLVCWNLAFGSKWMNCNADTKIFWLPSLYKITHFSHVHLRIPSSLFVSSLSV